MSLLPESVQIYVDQECIKAGVKGNPKYCPIALACKKYLPKGTVNFVGPLTMNIGGIDIISPKEVSPFVRDFDNGNKVEPFDFTLDLTKVFNGNYSSLLEN